MGKKRPEPPTKAERERVKRETPTFVTEKIRTEWEMCPVNYRWQPSLVVFHPDAKNPARYRTQYIVTQDGNNRKDPDQSERVRLPAGPCLPR